MYFNLIMLGIFLLGHCPVLAMDEKEEKPPTAFSGLKRTKSFSHNSRLASGDPTIPNTIQELATQKSEGKSIPFLCENKKGILEHKGTLLYGSRFQKSMVEEGSCILYDGYLILPQEYPEEATFEEKLKKYKASLMGKREEGEGK